MVGMAFKTTAEIAVPKLIVDQIIGQEKAVNIVKKAAKQRRNVVLIGTPGTGKSMLGQALAEMSPKSKLVDILCLPNVDDEDAPKIEVVGAGKGKPLLERAKYKSKAGFKNQQVLLIALSFVALLLPWWIRDFYGDIMAAASLIAGIVFVAMFVISLNIGFRRQHMTGPKLLVDNSKSETAPFVDATGARAGALLGDCKHDPFQSGGLGTPAHLRVQAGAIHKANSGVLFIDEVATLNQETQQELLTALQEKKYPITGQSEKSAGAMVRTDPVPCDFVLVAAGNVDTVQKMHPALRSRIRGYGYEVYMNDTIENNEENRMKIARFVAQEVTKDGKIPHFTRKAVEEIINEAKRRSGRKGHLTLILRDLGGLVRAAGDLALDNGKGVVDAEDIMGAKRYSRTLEQQIADKFIEKKKDYGVIKVKGEEVGRVNGLAIIGGHSGYSGLIMPIEAVVTPGGRKKEFVATGKLGRIAKEAVENVSAIVKKVFGQDLEKTDVFVQFLQTYEGVEGDSASVAVAVSILSALKNIPIKQDLAMTGSLSIRGEVLPVGGVTPKIEAAIEAGIRKIIVPEANRQDVIITNSKKKIDVVFVKTIHEVIEHAFHGRNKTKVVSQFKKIGM